MDDVDLTWYGVRTLFVWARDGCYEERITLWRARDGAHAIELAELEAKEYGDGRAEYIGLAQSYHVADESFAATEGVEVFSLLRTSALSLDEYISTYFDTGFERNGFL